MLEDRERSRGDNQISWVKILPNVRVMQSTCTKCGDGAVYHRAYSGEYFCGPCFKASIVEKVRRTIAQRQLLHHGDRVGVALSGGKDSLSLLAILTEVRRGHSSELVALTVDEGIAGYRDEALSYTVGLCSKLGVKQVTVSYEELFGFTLDDALAHRSGRKITSCSICGPLRRRSLDIAAQKAGLNVIATAHNLDDFIQTFYINLLSGDVGRIPWLAASGDPENGFSLRRVKPLMEIYEAEVAFFAYLSKFPFQSVPCPYSSEGIRSEVRAFLNALEKKHPGVKYSMFKSVLAVSANMALTPRKSAQLCARCGFPSTSPVCSACQTVEMVQLQANIAGRALPIFGGG